MWQQSYWKVSFSVYQIANAEMAKNAWKDLLELHPEVIGKENRYNEKIKDIFGDQGGYR